MRSYDRRQLIRLHRSPTGGSQDAPVAWRREVEDTFDALGEVARLFHLELRRRPVRTCVHLRRLLHLVHLYGRQEVVAALAKAHEYQTYDAAYVETILLQERRRRELPSPTQVRPAADRAD